MSTDIPNARPPVVLDLDGSVGALPGERRLPLHDWQEAIRFGCGLPRMRAFARTLVARMPAFDRHGTVFMGSGDFHHLSAPLVARCIAAQGFTAQRPLRIVVLDNHPDNMRFPFGIHCGSWVRHAALLPQVAQVHVVGITSPDIGFGHCWENYLQPLRRGKLHYWSTGVDTRWSRCLGLGAAFHGFPDGDALVRAFCAHLAVDPQPTYLSVDKDAFAPDVVRTNWDQGVLREDHAHAVIATLQGRLAGSDVTGDVSSYRYRTPWKRWLSAGDGQRTEIAPETLQAWQAGQDAFNDRLLPALADAVRQAAAR